MNDFSTRFFAAIALMRASASVSPIGPGSASGARRRIAAGTIASISAAREAKPNVASIVAWSAAAGPMWRPTNAPCASSAASDGWGAAEDLRSFMASEAFDAGPAPAKSGRLLFADGRLVGRRLEQLRERGRVRRRQLEEPRRVRVGVDRLGGRRQLVVDGRDRSGDRRIDVGRGLHRLDDGARLGGSDDAPDLRQLDVDEIAERRLRVIGDADADGAVVARAHPLVRAGVPELLRDVHLVLLHQVSGTSTRPLRTN